MTNFDLIVVGSGPGGYVAAIRAAQLGFSTALVEKADMGGVCLNWGCIPTKALLRGAEVAHTLSEASHFGFNLGNVEFDLSKLVGHSRSVAGKLSQGIDYLMKKNNITVFKGTASVVDKGVLQVELSSNSVTLTAPHIILATGARARALPGLEVDGQTVWGVREAMTPKMLPKRLLIIGAGAIGVEFASLYNDLGSEVTLVEAVDRIVPAEDAEVSAHLQAQFAKRKISVLTNTTLQSIDRTSTGAHADAIATLQQGEETLTLAVDNIIVAVGITGNIENIGLENVGAQTERGFITTDAFSRTNVVGLYAIGDVAGPPWLAHKASHEGILCVEKIAGIDVQPLKAERIPGCTYCRPQIASVGLSEQKAKQQGLAVSVGKFNLSANGKALAIGDSDGFIKTVFDKKHR